MHHRTTAARVVLGIVSAGLLTAADYESRVPTYYDGVQFKVSIKELDPDVAAAVIAQPGNLNRLYDCDGCEPDGLVYVAVLDALKNDRTNSLWRGFQIEFNPGYPCHQFTSDEEIIAAYRVGEISLIATDIVYRGAVVRY
jgi:hypothetical protein